MPIVTSSVQRGVTIGISAPQQRDVLIKGIVHQINPSFFSSSQYQFFWVDVWEFQLRARSFSIRARPFFSAVRCCLVFFECTASNRQEMDRIQVVFFLGTAWQVEKWIFRDCSQNSLFLRWEFAWIIVIRFIRAFFRFHCQEESSLIGTDSSDASKWAELFGNLETLLSFWSAICNYPAVCCVTSSPMPRSSFDAANLKRTCDNFLSFSCLFSAQSALMKRLQDTWSPWVSTGPRKGLSIPWTQFHRRLNFTRSLLFFPNQLSSKALQKDPEDFIYGQTNSSSRWP